MPLKRRRRGAERRRQTRTDARLSMRVEGALVEGAGSQVVTETQNISASGVYCLCSHFLSPLSKVGLTIVLPALPGGSAANELLKCDAIVVRCDPAAAKRGDRRFQLACMFTDLTARHRDLLDAYVTWRNLQALRAAAAKATGRPARGAAPLRRASARARAARTTRAPASRTRAGRSSRAR